jgi:CheY-like chemotaxis protein
MLSRKKPDLILLDIEMPGMNGYELAHRLRVGGSDAPIIFVTANSAREYVNRAVEAGAAALLMKPLRSSQLLAKLRENI